MSKKEMLNELIDQQAVLEIKKFDDEMANVVHIWNEQRQGYDVINLNTGFVGVNNKLPTLGTNDFSWERADLICNMIRTGKSLSAICCMAGMPSQTILSIWKKVHPVFATRMQEARADRAEWYHDMAIDTAFAISNKDEVPMAKLQVDTLKWAAEKGDPQRFANIKSVDNGQKSGITVIIETGVPMGQAFDTTSIEVNAHGEYKGKQIERREVFESDGDVPFREIVSVEKRLPDHDSRGLGEQVSESEGRERKSSDDTRSDSYSLEPIDLSGANLGGSGAEREPSFREPQLSGYKKKTK